MPAASLPTLNGFAVGVAIVTISIIQGLKWRRPAWPSTLIAVAFAAGSAAFLNLPVETMATRFGEISGTLSVPSIPEISLARLQSVLPDAIAFCLLGAIESLLSAVVAAKPVVGSTSISDCPVGLVCRQIVGCLSWALISFLRFYEPWWKSNRCMTSSPAFAASN